MGHKEDSFVSNGTKLKADTISISLGIMKFHHVRIIKKLFSTTVNCTSAQTSVLEMPIVAYAADRPSVFYLFHRTPNGLRRDHSNHVDCQLRSSTPDHGLETCCRQYARHPS